MEGASSGQHWHEERIEVPLSILSSHLCFIEKNFAIYAKVDNRNLQ